MAEARPSGASELQRTRRKIWSRMRDRYESSVWRETQVRQNHLQNVHEGGQGARAIRGLRARSIQGFVVRAQKFCDDQKRALSSFIPNQVRPGHGAVDSLIEENINIGPTAI